MTQPNEHLALGEDRKISAARTISYKEDLVTSAPQKLYRYLRDLVVQMGFNIKQEREPEIRSLPIGDTGSVDGYIFGETNPVEVEQPFKLYQTLGLVFIIIGVIFLIVGISWISINIVWSIVLLILFIVFLIVGSALRKMHQFVSYTLQIWITGEVYRASARRERSIDIGIGGVDRVSMISELRLIIKSARIYSQNEGLYRKIVRIGYPQEMLKNFNDMIDSYKTKILPRIELPMTADEVKAEVVSERKSMRSEEALRRLDQEAYSIEEKLSKLKKLYDKGLITEEEYNLKRKDLLDKL